MLSNCTIPELVPSSLPKGYKSITNAFCLHLQVQSFPF